MPSINRLRLPAIPLLIFILAVTARLAPGPRTIDDAYITYRYARNILAGNGFVYNPGERVLGTTTPLYTVLLTGLGSLTGGVQAPFPSLSLVLNALLDGLTCLLLIRLGRDLGSPWAGSGAAIVWAIAPFSVTFAIGGLETSLYVFLILSAAWCHLGKSHVLAALLAALSLLTRPDALILLGPLMLDRWLQVWPVLKTRQFSSAGFRKQIQPAPDRLSIAELAAFALPVLLWIIFASQYFGSPLPHSIAAKSLAYHLPREAALVRLLQHYATPFLGHLTFGLSWIKVGIVLYPFLYLVGARRLLRNNVHTWPFLLFPWLYLIIFAAANPLIFRWYLTPPLPFYIFGILCGVETLLDSVFNRRPESRRGEIAHPAPPAVSNVIFILLVILLPSLLSARDWQWSPTHGLKRPAPGMAWYQLELLYQQAADWINSHRTMSKSEFLLAAGDVGVLGYTTGLKILDTVGLNSPISTHYYPLDPNLYAINYAIPPDLIIDQKPDMIVILEVYGRLSLLKDERFQSQYRLVHKISTDVYGSEGMLIFEQLSSP